MCVECGCVLLHCGGEGMGVECCINWSSRWLCLPFCFWVGPDGWCCSDMGECGLVFLSRIGCLSCLGVCG